MKKISLTVWLLGMCCLLNGLFSKVSAQSVTLSSPASSSTYVDTATALFTISDPVGAPQQIQLVFTYTSGYYTNAIGSVWTLTMKSNTPSPGSFSFKPTDLTNAVNPFTASPSGSMLEGLYSVYCQYVRPASAGGTTLKTTSRSNVYLDLLTVSPAFTYTTGVTVNTNTGVFTLGNHLLTNNAPVTLSGVNGGITNIYYVSVQDSSNFSLVTTAGGTNYLTVTNTNSPKVSYAALTSNARFGGSQNLIYYTLGESYLSGSAHITFTGVYTNLTLNLVDNTLTGRFMLNRTNITSSLITSASATNLPDGLYNVAISYQDRFSHQAAVTTLTNVLFDAVTQQPSIISPSSFSPLADGSAIVYILPEIPLSGSVLLTFSNGTNHVVFNMSDSVSNQFVFSLTNYGSVLPSGVYSITLSYSDSLGNPASSATVNGVSILGLPIITTNPTNVIADIGSNVTFQVGVGGANAYTYQWYYTDADPIATAGGYALTYADFTYGAVVTNAGYGYTNTPNVYFTGGGGSGAQGYVSMSNGTVTFITVTNAGFGYTTPPNVTIDPPVSLLAGETNNNLTVSNFSPLNLGSYWVVVSDTYGSVTSSVATTTLSGTPPPQPPSVLVAPSDTNISLHNPLTLAVTAGGTPPISYQWTQGGTNLSFATNSTFQLSDFRTTNVGTYAVILSSPYGSVTSSVAQVSMLPSLTRPFKGFTQIWGETGAFSVTAVGTGTLQYQWYFNGQAIDGATSNTYSIGNLQFTNAGAYNVVVTSSLGSVTNAAYQVVVNPANIRLGMFAGVVIDGTVGNAFAIQSCTNLNVTNQWVTETNLTLTQPEQIWFDAAADSTQQLVPKKFYRVMALP